MINLLGNAIKFTEKGEVFLELKSLSEGVESIKLHISVKDTGIGMKPEVTSKLFSAFTQADNSMTRKYGGTGLGLAFSKELVQQMQGEISVTSFCRM